MLYQPFKLTAFSLTALVLVISFAKGQNQKAQFSLLSGVLLDYETKNPVPYANLVIEGSNVGTSSSEGGVFYLSLKGTPMEYLRISSIGYSTWRLKIDSLRRIDSLVIYLKPSVIHLDEVVVQATPVSASDFVREAIHSLDKNTYRGDYRLEWYATMVSTDSARDFHYSLETVFDDYHIGGQTRQVIRQQRETGISPKLVDNPKDTACTLVPWFELGLAEIANAEYGVLNLKNIVDFSFRYEGVLGLDGDSVYVIKYEATSHRYQVTGATRNVIYRGKLYITTGTHAIVRHTLEHGRRDFIKEEVLYKKIGNYYFPYYVKGARNLNMSKRFQPFHTNTYILRDIRLDNVEYQAGYNWCDNRAPYDAEFWNANYPRK